MEKLHVLSLSLFVLFSTWFAGQSVVLALKASRPVGLWETFGFGWMFWTLSVGILGHLGVLSSSSVCLLLLFLCGFVFLKRKEVRWDPIKKPAFSRFSFLLFILLSVFIVARLFLALTPNPGGDALYYHLPSAWLWASTGKVFLIDWLTWFMQGGTGEYYYSLAMVFTDSKFVALLVCRVLHFFFGGIASVGLVYCLSRRWMPRQESLLVCLSLITFTTEANTLTYAKNDGFLLYFCLLTTTLWFHYRSSRGSRELFLFYAVGGFTFTIKYSALFFLIPLFIVFWISEWKSKDLWTKKQFAGFLIATGFALPISLRNWIYSGNPLFPAMNSLFNSPLLNPYLESIIGSFTHVSGGFQESVSAWIKRVYLEKYHFPFALGIFFLKGHPAQGLMWVSLLSFFLCVALTGVGNYSRFVFFQFAILSLLSVLWISKRKSYQAFLKGLVLVSILATSGYDLALRNLVEGGAFFFSDTSIEKVILKNKPVYSIQRWANQNLRQGKTKILSAYDNESYFLDHPLSVPQNDLRASLVHLASDYQDALKEFKNGYFTHLLVQKGQEEIFKNLFESEHFIQSFKLIREDRGYRLFEFQETT